MEQLVRISKAIALTDEENKSIDFEIVRVETAQGTFDNRVWDNEKLTEAESEQPFKFKAKDFDCLKNHADASRAWPRGDQALTLKAKFEAAVED